MLDASAGRVGGISSFPAYRMDHTRATGASALLVDSDVLVMQPIMCRVKDTHPKLYQVACDAYIHGLSPASSASRQRCHRDTVYARLDALNVLVAALIVDRAKNVKAGRADFKESRPR